MGCCVIACNAALTRRPSRMGEDFSPLCRPHEDSVSCSHSGDGGCGYFCRSLLFVRIFRSFSRCILFFAAATFYCPPSCFFRAAVAGNQPHGRKTMRIKKHLGCRKKKNTSVGVGNDTGENRPGFIFMNACYMQKNTAVRQCR